MNRPPRPLTLAAFALLALASAAISNAYPLSGDIPVFPAGDPAYSYAAGVGGTASAFPFDTVADVGAPAIGAITETGYATVIDEVARGDTLIATGQGFTQTGFAFRYWDGDQNTNVVALSTSHLEDNKAAVKVPDNAINSTHFIWPTASNGSGGTLYGNPIRINAPAVTWTYPREILKTSAGTANRKLILLGRNLAKPGRVTYVVIEGATTFATLTKTTAHELHVSLPALNAGLRKVWVYSGGGGKYGWSEPVEIEVVDATAVPDHHVSLSDYTDSDPLVDATEAIQTAIDEMPSTGGYLDFEAREYLISDTLVVNNPRVVLNGFGPADYQSAGTTLLFQDTFDNGGLTDTNLVTNLTARQSGDHVDNHGAVTWVETAAGTSATKDFQLGQDTLQTKIGVTTADTARVVAYPNANFGAGLAGRRYILSYDMSLELFDGSATSVPRNQTEFRFISARSVADLTGSSSTHWPLAVRFMPFRPTGEAWAMRPTITLGGLNASLADIPFEAVGNRTPSVLVEIEIDEIAQLLTIRYGGKLILGCDATSMFAGGFAGDARYFAFSGNKAASTTTTSGLRHSADNFAITLQPELQTTLRYTGTPDALVQLAGDQCGIEKMTLINQHTGADQSVVKITGAHNHVRDSRIVFKDLRRWGGGRFGPPFGTDPFTSLNPPDAGTIDSGFIDDGAVLVNTAGPAHFDLTRSRIYAAGPGVQIGQLQESWRSSGPIDPSSNYVAVTDSSFWGLYGGEPDRQNHPSGSGRSVGLYLANAKNVLVSKNKFESLDKERRAILGRTLLAFNSATQRVHISWNTSRNVGSHPSAVGMNDNQGEQYLFHWRYPYGGLFHTTSAGADFVRVRTNQIAPLNGMNPHYFRDSRGSRVIAEVGSNDHWVVFISKGAGAGQYRTVIGSEPYSFYAQKLTVDRPWRIQPDTTSRINLITPYRDITLVGNFIDGGSFVPGHKTHGIVFFFDAIGNHVVDNEIRHVTAGVVFNSRYRAPTAWNHTAGNVIENIYDGDTGDTSLYPASYVDGHRITTKNWPAAADRVWYSVGNVFRNNVCFQTDPAHMPLPAGATNNVRFSGDAVGVNRPDPVAHTDAGMVMPLVEKNTFFGTSYGIAYSNPVYGGIARNNVFLPLAPEDSGNDLVREYGNRPDPDVSFTAPPPLPLIIKDDVVNP